MMRRFGVLCICLLLLPSCTGSRDEGSDVQATPSPPATSTTAAIPTTASTTIDAPTTTIALSMTTGSPSLNLEQPVLVVNGDGVFEINTDGAIRQLVAGSVAYAVDDTRGGLLFQVDRGRQVFAGFKGEPPSGRRTIIWWIPMGGSVPQELLVPTPGEGQYLSLHDAFAIGDSFAVVYERHEGTIPFDSDSGRVADMADRLRVFNVAPGYVTELYRVRGYEWNLDNVTAGAGLVSATEVQTGGTGCRLFDAANGELVSSPGFPSATPACFEDFNRCAGSCALSPNATQVAYGWVRGEYGAVEWEVAGGDLATGTETARFSLPSERWLPAGIDIDDDLVLLNRTREGLYEEPALLADIGNPDSAPIALPMPGRARFVTQTVDIGAPVAVAGNVPSGLSYWRYGGDGLFRVADGIESKLMDGPVERAWDDCIGGVITANGTATEVLHLPAGETTPIPLFSHSPESYAYARFTGILDGHPALFFAGLPEGAGLDEWPCSDWALNSRDLMTGEERRHLCLPIEDAGFGIRSVGDGLLVGAPYGLCGGTGTSTSIQFWDTAGNPVEVPANPYPPGESCAPCELDALISAGGHLLAYRHRPDSFHPDSPYYSGPECGGGSEQVEAWWEGSQDATGEIVVLDLNNGEEVWRTEVPADARLSDFDGRYLAVARKGQSVVYDTAGIHPSIEMPGQVVLVASQSGPE